MDDATFRMMMGSAPIAIGQQAFTTPGTYQFQVPNVGVLSVVCIGGGQEGSGLADGGYGGDLRYIVDLPVVPFEILTITVGRGGAFFGTAAGRGGSTYISRGSTVLLCAASFGQLPTSTPLGPGPSGGTVGGGNGGPPGAIGTQTSGAAGGGAGGYSGNGNTVTGGSGGRGAVANGNTMPGGGGGGVGIFGEGASGANASSVNRGGKGGSGGNDAGNGSASANDVRNGGNFGGGGGGASANYFNPGDGGGGACRIIWGPNRAYPSTNTQDMT